MKVLVTGSSGFVGSHLVPLLKDTDGIEVVEFEGDLSDKTQVERFFVAHPGIDQAVHLAGAAAGTDLAELFKANVLTTHNLFQVGIKAGIKKVVLASSYGVYGPPQNRDASRETDQPQPDSAYGLSKKWAEDVVLYYHATHGLEYVLLRFASIYGPGNTKGVIDSMSKSIDETGTVTIYGDGLQTRSFLHVSDACRAILAAVNHATSDTFNISDTTRLTLAGVVEKFAQKKKFEVIHASANNPSQDLAIDVTKAQDVLGFSPTVTELEIE